MKRSSAKALLLLSAVLAASWCSGKVPLLLNREPNTTGIRRITNIGNVSSKSIKDEEYTDVTEGGIETKVLVRLPFRDGKVADKVNAVVFIAPYPSDQFRSVRSPLVSALVARLGCAVVSIPMKVSKEKYWERGSFYLYPEAGYFPLVERALAKVRQKYGDERTPLFSLGSSGGAVMSLYLAQSKTLKLDGVVAFELSQGEDITPGLFDTHVPVLALNPEDNPWNLRIARRLAEEVSSDAAIEFCITRPRIDYDDSAGYYRRAGGRYANELAYCFLRDAIDAKMAGAWPAKWTRKPVKIEALEASWAVDARVSSPDFEQLYQLTAHSLCEASPDGRSAYIAAPPFYRQASAIVVKKGVWNYLDQVRLAAALIPKGFVSIICSVPETEKLPDYLGAQLARIQGTKLPCVIVAVIDDEVDVAWVHELERTASETPLVLARKGRAFGLVARSLSRTDATLRVHSAYLNEEKGGTGFFADPTWMLPKDFSDLMDATLLSLKGDATASASEKNGKIPKPTGATNSAPQK